MNSPVAYLNGEWTPASDLSVPVDDLGFLMGVTVVERLRTFQGKVFRVPEHMQRLRRSLEIVEWNVDELVDEVTSAIAEFMPRNRELLLPSDDWYVVVYITPGSTPDASQPNVCVHGGPLLFSTWAEQYETGVKVVVTKTRQVPNDCWPHDMKCRSRMHYYLADREASAKLPGARAILLDHEGFVGEASTANVVAYFADRGLVTPRLEKVLPGVTQHALFDLATDLDFPHEEADISVEDLRQADEVFLTSTSTCLLPVVQIDDKAVGTGSPGPVYAKLLASWSDHTGVNVAEQARLFSSR